MNKKQGLKRMPKKVRFCRMCKEKLPRDRYFHHKSCVEQKGVVYQDWSEIYDFKL